MASKPKISRSRHSASKDSGELRKFMTIVAIAALALMILMYFIFVG
ncbi:MAG: hypothetical protein IT260_06325 [Saprospiraceae bacterium]|nr:hypothetical protein [Saprospiraceae bacterium]